MEFGQRNQSNLNTGFSLDFLASYPQFVPTVAEWIFNEWGHRDPDISLETTIQLVKSRLSAKSPPLAMIGLLKGEPIACSSILIRELDPFPQYTYWLASVFVLSDFRNQGIGSAVVELSSQIGVSLGLRDLYLYTHSHEDFYTNLGFMPIERPVYQGRTIVIMRRVLRTSISPENTI